MNPKARLLPVLSLTIVAGSFAWATVGGAFPNLQIGKDNNNKTNAFVQPQDPALSGGDRDQTLQFGDTLFGTPGSDLLQGRLGVDLLIGAEGDDLLLGGTEHFNPANRDRAFGGPGSDAFLWSPGDGSDFFDGGPGLDAVVFGLMGEIDENGNVSFGVSSDQEAGDVFFDPATGLPQMDLVNSPGFCNVIDDSTSPEAASELDDLGLDHLVQFFIRAAADSFEAGLQSDDNGLRVTLHLKDVEFVVCTNRDGGVVEAFDLRTTPPTPIRPKNVPVPFLNSILQ